MSAYVIPFLVADRPASLRIIKGSGLHRYDVLVGLMGHANTSTNFQKLFGIYPCSEPGTHKAILKTFQRRNPTQHWEIRQTYNLVIVKKVSQSTLVNER